MSNEVHLEANHSDEELTATGAFKRIRPCRCIFTEIHCSRRLTTDIASTFFFLDQSSFLLSLSSQQLQSLRGKRLWADTAGAQADVSKIMIVHDYSL